MSILHSILVSMHPRYDEPTSNSTSSDLRPATIFDNDSIKACAAQEPETMLYNLTKTINWNDISDIDYTERSPNNHKHNPLSDRFCDNAIFYYMVPINPYAKNKNDYLSKYLAERTSKIKRILQSHDINVNKRYIKPTYSSIRR